MQRFSGLLFGFHSFYPGNAIPVICFYIRDFFYIEMANRSEFIAILASGVSLRRILRPYWVGGFFLAILLYFANYYILRKLMRSGPSLKLNIPRPRSGCGFKSIYMRVDSFTYCGIRYYDTTAKGGGTFFLERVRNHKVVYNLRADNINWDTARKLWKLTGVIERKIGDLKEDVTLHQQVFKNFNFRPLDLQRDEYVKDRLTTPELNRMIEMEKLRGSETVKELTMEKAKRDQHLHPL
jgi:lipopolysaccharide export system permease protein